MTASRYDSIASERAYIKLDTVETIGVSKQGLYNPAQRLLPRRQPTMQIFYPRQRGHRINMTFNMETIGRQHHNHHFLYRYGLDPTIHV